jgi:hypothetical protein
LACYINDIETPYLFLFQPLDNTPYDMVKKTNEIKNDYKTFVCRVQKYCPYLIDWSQVVYMSSSFWLLALGSHDFRAATANFWQARPPQLRPHQRPAAAVTALQMF